MFKLALHFWDSKGVCILLRLLRLFRRQINYKHFFGAGKFCINTSPAPERCFFNTFQASPVSERYQINKYIEILLRAGPAFKYTSPAPEKSGKYLKTPFRRRRSIYTHFSGAGEVLI